MHACRLSACRLSITTTGRAGVLRGTEGQVAGHAIFLKISRPLLVLIWEWRDLLLRLCRVHVPVVLPLPARSHLFARHLLVWWVKQKGPKAICPSLHACMLAILYPSNQVYRL